ncbi:MAG: hypothetical protein IJX16_02115 [Clostridia bacterium]|nr:hypothetical protein [Clostridia bacterium]
MDVKIYPSPLSGSIEAESLKATALRAIIASAFADTDTEIIIKGETEDILSTVKCLTKMGASVSNQRGKIVVSPIDFNEEQVCPDEFDVGDSVPTFRFLAPAVSILFGGGTFVGKAKLPKKQTESYLFALSGVGFTSDRLPLKLNGKLKGGNLTVSGGVGSQAISGILMALPLLKTGSVLTVVGDIPSSYLVEITLDVMRDFGINVERKGNIFTVGANQKYISPKKYQLEGDYGLSAYLLCAGKFGGGVTVTGLRETTRQPEKQLLSLIDECWENDSVSLKGVFDLIYPFTVLACYKNGDTVIKNAERKTEKSSERFTAFLSQLTKMGANVCQTQDGVIVKGQGRLKGGAFVDGFGDAKTAMALTIASTGAEEPTYLLSAEFAMKSYPAFFNDLVRLGGKCQAN